MKGSQKRWQSNNTDSVIATLMGFEELRPQQPFHEKHRVLSESYTRKVASIALRPGSLVSVGRSRSANNEIVHGVKDVSGVRSSQGKNENVLDKCVNSGTSSVRTSIRSRIPAGVLVSKSLSGASYIERKSFGRTDKHCAARHVLRHRQKLGHDSLTRHVGEPGIDSVSDSLNFPPEMINKTCLFSTSISGSKPKSEKVAYDLEELKFDVHCRPGYREHGKSLMPQSRKPHHEFTYKELDVNHIVPSRHSCIACNRSMDRISPQERCRSKFEVVSKPGCIKYSHDPRLSVDQSSLASKSKEQNFKRWKTAKEVQEFQDSGRNQTRNKMLALADKKSMPRILDMRLRGNGSCRPSGLQSRSSDSSSPVFNSTDVWDDDRLKISPDFKFEATKKILSAGRNLTQDESTVRERESKEQTASQKNMLESKGGRGSKQFQTSLVVDSPMSLSSNVSELSSCLSSDNILEANTQGVRNEIDNCFESDRCKEIGPSQRNSNSSISNLAAQCTNDASYASEDALSVGHCSTNPQSESHPGIFPEEGGSSSNVEEIFSREASFNEFSEEDSAYSNCSGIGPPESLENLKRTSQHSPDSVLEPFDMKYSSFECFDRIGLRLQLQALNFESEETYSEGSMMVVSSNEDFEEQFGDLSPDGRKVKRWLGDEESRNFSYLVDVLDEAGFCDMDSYVDFNTWHSLECPISPSVFDTLEKKYGKQTSWQKSERQLLFDRINSGLLEIFNPVINFHVSATSIRRRFCSSFRRDEFEDELWVMLISQEKDKSKELSEKALDKWLELEEGINIICRELETSLFDELAMELASLWN